MIELAGRISLVAGLLLVCATSAECTAADVPTRVLDARAETNSNDSGYTIKGIAAGGADSVAAVLETPSKRTPLWYSLDRGSTAALLQISETGRTFDYVPARLESRLGVSSAGVLCFSADLSPTPRGEFGAYRRFFDSLWFGVPALVSPAHLEGRVIPPSANPGGPERRWRFTSWPGVTYSNIPYWMAGESEAERGPSVGRAVYVGAGTGVRRVLGSGQSVLPDRAAITPSVGAIDSFSVSALGTSVLAVVRVDLGSADTAEVRVVRRALDSDAPATTLLSQSATWQGLGIRRFYLPVSGEVPGCGHPATWAVALDTTDSPDRDSILVQDGQKTHQEGELFDGLRLSGGPLVLSANATGDLLVLWGASGPGQGAVVHTVAFLNQSKLLDVGDAVDVDGDGSVDDAHVTYIAPLGALSGLASDGKVSVYLSVRINDEPALVRVRAAGRPRTGSADYNGDGDSGTDADIEAFFQCLAGHCCPSCAPDFNGDGDSGTDADIEAFFRVLAGGNC
jgi:hypothetical protein